MYWQLTTKAKRLAQQQQLAAEEHQRAAREAATLDAVTPGEQQPEVEHDFSGEATQTGTYQGRHWRDGKSFQYTLSTRGAKSVELAVTYWGGDTGRTFDILANGRLLATQTLNAEQRGRFIEKRYPIPTEVLAAAPNGRITIRFVAKTWVAGGVFDVRLMRGSNPTGKRD